MAWSRIQSAKNSQDASSITATFTTANLSAGSKIIAYVGSSNSGGNPAISSVTATGGNTLTQIGAASAGTARMYIYAVDASGSGGTTMVGTKPVITATWASGGGLGIVVQEVSGLLAGNTTAMADGTPGTLTGSTDHHRQPVVLQHRGERVPGQRVRRHRERRHRLYRGRLDRRCEQRQRQHQLEQHSPVQEQHRRQRD